MTNGREIASSQACRMGLGDLLQHEAAPQAMTGLGGRRSRKRPGATDSVDDTGRMTTQGCDPMTVRYTSPATPADPARFTATSGRFMFGGAA